MSNPSPSYTVTENTRQWVEEIDIRAGDFLILVVGPTGTGKSSFINRIIGEEVMAVGHGLTSRTTEVAWVPHQFPPHRVILVDTPGIDDPFESNINTVETILNWLNKSCHKDVHFGGVIYFHNIASPRFPTLPQPDLDMLEASFKPENEAIVRRVTLVTSMWNKVDEADSIKREQELKDNQWKAMIKAGANLHQFDNSPERAREILETAIRRGNERIPNLQEYIQDFQQSRQKGLQERKENKFVRILKTFKGKNDQKIKYRPLDGSPSEVDIPTTLLDRSETRGTTINLDEVTPVAEGKGLKLKSHISGLFNTGKTQQKGYAAAAVVSPITSNGQQGRKGDGVPAHFDKSHVLGLEEQPPVTSTVANQKMLESSQSSSTQNLPMNYSTIIYDTDLPNARSGTSGHDDHSQSPEKKVANALTTPPPKGSQNKSADPKSPKAEKKGKKDTGRKNEKDGLRASEDDPKAVANTIPFVAPKPPTMLSDSSNFISSDAASFSSANSNNALTASNENGLSGMQHTCEPNVPKKNTVEISGAESASNNGQTEKNEQQGDEPPNASVPPAEGIDNSSSVRERLDVENHSIRSASSDAPSSPKQYAYISSQTDSSLVQEKGSGEQLNDELPVSGSDSMIATLHGESGKVKERADSETAKESNSRRSEPQSATPHADTEAKDDMDSDADRQTLQSKLRCAISIEATTEDIRKKTSAAILPRRSSSQIKESRVQSRVRPKTNTVRHLINLRLSDSL